MKKLLKFFVFFMSCGAFLALGGFFALVLYYRSHFPVNTWINGVYCTGKTVEEVNQELAQGAELSVVQVAGADGVFWEMDMEEAGIRPDYTLSLREYLEQNATGFWPDNLRSPVSCEVAPQGYRVEEEKLRKCFDSLPLVEGERTRPEGVLLCRTQEGYTLKDGNRGRLDPEAAYVFLKECLKEGVTQIRLEESCYRDLPDTEADTFQRELWGQVSRFQARCGEILYDMGAEKFSLTSDIAGGFLATDPVNGSLSLDGEGKIVVSPEGVRQWVESLAARYDTCGTERDFAATRGETVRVEYVTYGTKLDVEAETAYLLEALQEGAEAAGTHVPAYSQEGYARGLDDIGDTYIEVDLTEQKLYYYVEGEIALETDVVTGNLAKKYGTPEGINFVYNKQRNRTLRGPGYSSFVKYWMPVKGGIGLHDASWRSKFGGEIYKTNGSHGCINMSTQVAARLYDMVELGTPVVMFY